MATVVFMQCWGQANKLCWNLAASSAAAQVFVHHSASCYGLTGSGGGLCKAVCPCSRTETASLICPAMGDNNYSGKTRSRGGVA